MCAKYCSIKASQFRCPSCPQFAIKPTNRVKAPGANGGPLVFGYSAANVCRRTVHNQFKLFVIHTKYDTAEL